MPLGFDIFEQGDSVGRLLKWCLINELVLLNREQSLPVEDNASAENNGVTMRVSNPVTVILLNSCPAERKITRRSVRPQLGLGNFAAAKHPTTKSLSFENGNVFWSLE